MQLLERTIAAIRPPDEDARRQAKSRLDQLTMPHWALGRLMDLAVDLAGMTGSVRPPVGRRAVITMAADHGVVAEGVSKYPQEVTPQMVGNFVAGGAGINALAHVVGAKVVVVDMGVVGDLSRLAAEGKILSRRIGPGTKNIAQGPAMLRDEAVRAIEAGIDVVRQLAGQTDVVGTGDMGIGNTTPSTAIVACLTGAKVAEVTGRGTGIDDATLRHKVAIVERALAINKPDPKDGVDVLAKVGGFEIGGIAGVILGAAALRKPVLVDGFISTAGAMRDKEQKQGADAAAKPSTPFIVGLLVCVFAGIFCPMMNFSVFFGQPISKQVVDLGTVASYNVGYAQLLPALLGGSFAQIVYCIYLFAKNKSFKNFFVKGTGTNWLRGGMMAVYWFVGMTLYTIASAIYIKDVGPIVGWPLFLASTIIVSNILGVITKEWKGVSKKAFMRMYAGIACLIVAIALASLSNLFLPK